MNRTDIENMSKLLFEKSEKAFEMPKEKKDSGADHAAKDLKKVEEYKNIGSEDGKPKEVKTKKSNLKEENIMIKSSFDSLFKSTLNEQNDMIDDENVFGDEGEASEDVMGDEGETTEEVDISTRLQMIASDLQSVIDELSGESSEEEPTEGEEDMEESMDEDEMSEGMEEEEMEEGYDAEEVTEAKFEPEPKPMADSGKKLMGKSNKVSTSLTQTKGTANHGSIKNAPEPQSLGDAGGKKFMGKSNKVSSSVSAGKDLF